MTPNPPEPPRSPPTFELAVFAVCVVVHLFLVSLGWKNSLIQIHESRQVQTALTARCLQTEPWRPDYPLPVFGPPWSAPYEFPFYQTAVAGVANLTGWPVEQAGRAVALGFFYLALPACFQLLAACGVPAARRWLFPSLLLVSPVFLYYSRSLMIESTAFCASTWFLLAFTRALAAPGWRWTAAALGLGALAGLAKATTFAVFLAAALLATIVQLASRFRQGAGPRALTGIALRALLGAVPALGATMAWIRFTDGIKNSNPLSSVLSSTSIHDFNYGTLAQRLDPACWGKLAATTFGNVLTAENLTVIGLFGLLLANRRRWAVAALGACFLAGPLAFSNLYLVHDYYFYATGAFLLGALVVAWSELLDLTVFPEWARRTTIIVSLGLQVLAFARGYLPFQRTPLAAEPELGRLLAKATAPDDIVLVFGHDWNPRLAYYSQRRAVMVVDRKFNDLAQINEVLDRIEPGRIKVLVATGSIRLAKNYLLPFLTRLKLFVHPAIFSGDTQVYVASDLVNRIQQEAASLQSKEFTTYITTAADGGSPRLRLLAPVLDDSNAASILKPAPIEVIHPFGMASHTVDNQTALDAHAPTDFLFRLAGDAREVVIEFGVMPSAYAGPKGTDGVEFRLEWVDPVGKRTLLHSVLLDPVNRAQDRGRHREIVALPPGAVGELWARTLPGPSGSNAFDWAYWTAIEIR